MPPDVSLYADEWSSEIYDYEVRSLRWSTDLQPWLPLAR
jgi:hypothetical protein